MQEGRIRVAGSWCGQVQRTAHGDVKGYSCGFDHETLYFVIRKFGAHPTCDEVAAHPVARLIVWGEEQGGRRTTLGRASIFLHQITGHLGGGATAWIAPLVETRLNELNMNRKPRNRAACGFSATVSGRRDRKLEWCLHAQRHTPRASCSRCPPVSARACPRPGEVIHMPPLP